MSRRPAPSWSCSASTSAGPRRPSGRRARSADLTLHGGASVSIEQKWTGEEIDKGSRERLARILAEIG
ncbi:hypothetical protein ACFY05_11200 [Microtetraspora fusca]|uniref:Uncharacterized protein n=1 Tax=Microtetraspora fusca TaxID=1997 RepID=A0ABW6V304_MICFU